MEKCSNSSRYKATKKPSCNQGKGCDACNSKWRAKNKEEKTETVSWDKDKSKEWLKNIIKETENTLAWPFVEDVTKKLEEELKKENPTSVFVSFLVGQIVGRLDLVKRFGW